MHVLGLDREALLRDPPGLRIECVLWSLQVDEAGEGGGGMSGLLVAVDSGGLGSFSFTSNDFSSLRT